MTEVASGEKNGPPEAEPARKVGEVCRQWLVYEDGALAQNLQEEEFDYKYGFNRKSRQTARVDVPVARMAQTEEEERLQRERMQQLQQHKHIADQDAIVAQEIQEQEQQRKIIERKRIEEDALLAAASQRRFVSSLPRDEDDALVAQQFQTEEMYQDEQDRIKRQIEDEEIAKQLQEKEMKRYERKLRGRELAKERKRIEREQQRDTDVIMSGYKTENVPATIPEVREDPQASAAITASDNLDRDLGELSLENSREPERLLRHDGRVEDLGDFSDFYIQPSPTMAPSEKKELQELQDEELARILQDQEHKRGSKIDREKLRKIENRDEELARIMQQQEKLKAKKRHHKNAQKQLSEPADDLPTEQAAYNRSRSEPDHRHSERPQEMHAYMEQDPTSRNHGYREHDLVARNHGFLEQDPDLHEDRARGRVSPERDPRLAGSHVSSDPDPKLGSHPTQNIYHDRPLPPTSRESTEHALPSSPLPGYRGTNTSQSSSGGEEGSHSRSSNMSNVIAAIDPTFRSRGPELMTQHEPLPPIESSRNISPVAARQSTLPGTLGGEDGYCDLEDVQNLAPVQGQKRSTLKRGDKKSRSKKGSCKQQ